MNNLNKKRQINVFLKKRELQISDLENTKTFSFNILEKILCRAFVIKMILIQKM